MKKQILLVALILGLIGASNSKAMQGTCLRLYVDDPAVQIIIPIEGNEDFIIGGETFNGTEFSVPFSTEIGIKFPNEQPVFINRETLRIYDALTIHIEKQNPQRYNVVLEPSHGQQTDPKIVYIHNVGE